MKKNVRNKIIFNQKNPAKASHAGFFDYPPLISNLLTALLYIKNITPNIATNQQI
jgi:hypothetical protein